MKKVFFDTETTGLTPGSIAQLSLIIEYEDGNLDTRNYFMDIDFLSEGAQEVCGRTLEFYKEVSKGRKFADYSKEILEIFSDSILVAHNEKFDENFLSTEFWRMDIIYKPNDRLCTMEYFKPIVKLPGRSGSPYKNPKLSELIEYFKLDTDKIKKYSDMLFKTENENYGLHDARYDTTAMFVVFQVYRESLNGNSNWISSFRKA